MSHTRLRRSPVERTSMVAVTAPRSTAIVPVGEGRASAPCPVPARVLGVTVGTADAGGASLGRLKGNR